MKSKSTPAKPASVPAVTQAASLASRAIARMEADASATLAASENKSLQMIAAGGKFSALIKHGKTTIQIEGDDFAVSTAE
jgi:hypothetical protein